MRIHTNATYADIMAALAAVRTGENVYADISIHKSRTHARAFNVKLTGESRRRPMWAQYNDPDAYAATWDAWGVFLAAVFNADSGARCGSVKQPTYANAPDFHSATVGRFRNGWPTDAHGDHVFRYAGVPYSQSCRRCAATVRWGPARTPEHDAYHADPDKRARRTLAADIAIGRGTSAPGWLGD